MPEEGNILRGLRGRRHRTKEEAKQGFYSSVDRDRDRPEREGNRAGQTEDRRAAAVPYVVFSGACHTLLPSLRLPFPFPPCMQPRLQRAQYGNGNKRSDVCQWEIGRTRRRAPPPRHCIPPPRRRATAMCVPSCGREGENRCGEAREGDGNITDCDVCIMLSSGAPAEGLCEMPEGKMGAREEVTAVSISHLSCIVLALFTHGTAALWNQWYI